jgi:glutaredoxin-like YruB-family protein
MNIIEIHSFENLKKELKASKRAYLLLFKSNSEASECAYKSLMNAAKLVSDVKLMSADVTKVRDIHSEFNITSAPSLLYFENSEFKSSVKGCNSDEYYANLISNNLYKAKMDSSESAQKNVLIYTTPTCPHCTTLKNHLKNHNIKFREIDVSKDAAEAQKMVQKSGQQGVPQANIGGQMIVGFNKSKINELLNIK